MLLMSFDIRNNAVLSFKGRNYVSFLSKNSKISGAVFVMSLNGDELYMQLLRDINWNGYFEKNETLHFDLVFGDITNCKTSKVLYDYHKPHTKCNYVTIPLEYQFNSNLDQEYNNIKITYETVECEGSFMYYCPTIRIPKQYLESILI